MKKHIVFIGGPIQNAVGADGTFDPRTRHVVEQLISGLTQGGCEVRSAHRHERFGEMDVRGKFREVCLRDYRWMKSCELFVAILPLDIDGNVIPSGGTSIELGWASALGKPIILVCDPAPKYSHLVIGLDAIADVVKLDINRPDLTSAVSAAASELLDAKGLRAVAPDTNALSR